MGYGACVPCNFKRSARYIADILKGAKPADMPVEQPSKFDTLVNLKTAKALQYRLSRSQFFCGPTKSLNEARGAMPGDYATRHSGTPSAAVTMSPIVPTGVRSMLSRCASVLASLAGMRPSVRRSSSVRSMVTPCSISPLPR